MKLSRFILCIVALGAIAMTGCKKEDSTLVAGDNEIIIDGTIYPLHSFIQTEGGFPKYMDCYKPGTTGADWDYRFYGDVSTTNLSASLSIAPNALYMFSFEHRNEITKSFMQGYNPDGWSQANYIGEKEYSGQAIFKSGTISIKLDNVALTYKVDGELKDGRKVSAKVFVPVKDFTPVPWENQ